MKTFEEIWTQKEKEGYSYGHDALEQVRFGWDLRANAEPVKMGRVSWHETWMNVARSLAENRSHDPRLKVAAIIVPEDNTQIIAIGYNGDERGGTNAPESFEPGQSGFVHAENNALIKCDFNFPKRKRMYVTHSPCRQCAKLIINAEIVSVIYGEQYRDVSGLELLKQRGIEVMSLDEAIG